MNTPGLITGARVRQLASNSVQPQREGCEQANAFSLPEAVQHARLMRRDGIDAALAQRMMDAQASRAERRALADDVLVNDGHPDALQAQVEALHARYLQLAST